MLGYVLLLVGFVFFCNGMTLLGKTDGKEVGMLNVKIDDYIPKEILLEVKNKINFNK